MLAGAPPARAQDWRVIPPTAPAPPPPADAEAPYATIGGLQAYPDRLGLDAFGLTRYGLLLEVSFSVRNLGGRRGRVDVFFRPQGGSFISGAEGFYASVEGLVSVRRPFQTVTNDDSFDRVALFIPREELRLANGSYTLETVVLVRSADRLLGRAVFAFPYRHHIPKETGAGE